MYTEYKSCCWSLVWGVVGEQTFSSIPCRFGFLPPRGHLSAVGLCLFPFFSGSSTPVSPVSTRLSTSSITASLYRRFTGSRRKGDSHVAFVNCGLLQCSPDVFLL